MTTKLQRDRITWLVYFMLAFYGYCLNSFGPLTPFLRSELGISYVVASLHFTAFAVGILGAGLGSHLVIERFGRWRTLWLGAFGMSTGAVLLLVGTDPIVTIAAAFVMGLIGSLILAIMPAALADRHGERRAIALSEANLLASLISTAAPLAIGWFARTVLGWRPGLGLALLAPVALFFFFREGQAPGGQAPVVEAPRPTTPLPTRYWVFWAGLVLGVSIEFCMVFWSADFLESVRGLAKADAAQAVSLFLVGMILGRLLVSWLVARFATRAVVIGSLLVAGLGFALYWLAPGAIAALSGLLLTGLGVAGLYPLIMALAIEAAGPNVTQASARATLASGVAISILPLVLGRIADAVGIALAYGVVAVLLALTLIIIALARPQATA